MPSWERLVAFWASAVLGEASRRHIGGVLGRRRSVWEAPFQFLVWIASIFEYGLKTRI